MDLKYHLSKISIPKGLALIFYISLSLILTKALHTRFISIPTPKNKVIIFNNLMNSIETNIYNDDFQKVCVDSEKIVVLIENDINSLKDSEPNYAWNEINELMKAIPTQLCKS